MRLRGECIGMEWALEMKLWLVETKGKGEGLRVDISRDLRDWEDLEVSV